MPTTIISISSSRTNQDIFSILQDISKAQDIRFSQRTFQDKSKKPKKEQGEIIKTSEACCKKNQ